MQKISGEIILKCSKEMAFGEISSNDFAEKMDLAFKSPQKDIVFQNERVSRTITRIENVGAVDMERVYIPESFTIVSQRRPPMTPFVYFLGLQMLSDHEEGSLLRWVEEFELDLPNKPKEDAILSGLQKHERLQFQKFQDYFNKR